MSSAFKLIFFFAVALSFPMKPAAAQMAPYPASRLENTLWEGTYRVGFVTRPVLIYFTKMNARNEIQFFSSAKPTYFGAPGGCEYTPQGLRLTGAMMARDYSSGGVSLYACAGSAAEEQGLAQNPRRAPVDTFSVSWFLRETHLAGQETLRFKMSTSLIESVYELKRITSPPEDIKTRLGVK